MAAQLQVQKKEARKKERPTLRKQLLMDGCILHEYVLNKQMGWLQCQRVDTMT